MGPYLWVASLLAFLAMTRANIISAPHVIDPEPLSDNGCDCRIIQVKLDQLEYRVSKMFNQLQNKTETMLNDHFTELKQVIQHYQGEDQAQQYLEQQSFVSASSDLNGYLAEITEIPVQYVDTDFGPKWIVILQRTDGSVNFNRTWTEYQDGFGTEGRDFWIGLEKLHKITKDAPYELVVEMTDPWDTNAYARYDRFEIGSQLDGYPIVNLGQHSGTAGDGLGIHRSIGFSTFDNDSTGYHCSSKYGDGGWWFFNGGSCYESSLTGQWNTNSWSGIVWGKFSELESWTKLKSARMMIRSICDGLNNG